MCEIVITLWQTSSIFYSRDLNLFALYIIKEMTSPLDRPFFFFFFPASLSQSWQHRCRVAQELCSTCSSIRAAVPRYVSLSVLFGVPNFIESARCKFQCDVLCCCHFCAMYMLLSCHLYNSLCVEADVGARVTRVTSKTVDSAKPW